MTETEYFKQLHADFVRRTNAEPEHARMSPGTFRRLATESPDTDFTFKKSNYGIGKTKFLGVYILLDTTMSDEEIIFEGRDQLKRPDDIKTFKCHYCGSQQELRILRFFHELVCESRPKQR
jgi:hypothetical protein